MSFGVGIGDLLALSKLATDVYRMCKCSSKEFQGVSTDVANLRIILEDLNEDLKKDGVKLSPRREERLCLLLSNVWNALNDLQTELTKFDSLTTDRQRKYDAVRWGFKDVNEIRMRIVTLISSLNAIENVLARLEHSQLRKTIIKYFKEVHNKQAEGYERSMFSTSTAESIVQKETWDDLKKELEDIGLDGTVVEEKQEFITEVLQQAIQDGDLSETEVADLKRSQTAPPSSAATIAASTRSMSVAPTVTDNDAEPSAHQQQLHRWDTDATLLDEAYSARRQVTDPATRAEAEAHDLLTLHAKGARGASKKHGRAVALALRVLGIASDERLIEAADEGDAAATVRLIRRGANPRATDKWLWTPLHNAAYGGYDSIARILILHGADIGARTIDGETPLLLAERNGHKGIVDIISEECERRERLTEMKADRAEVMATAESGKAEAGRQ